MDHLMRYKISEIYPTIQGEGLLAGTPCTLVRLAGCTVGCSWCDTPYAWPSDVEGISAADVAGRWKLARESSDFVLLTGGEPGEQDLLELAAMMTAFGARLLLESAGTAPGWLRATRFFEHICVSPKLGIKEPLEDCLRAAHELKFIIGQTTAEEVRDFLHRNKNFVRDASVVVQPQSGMRAYQQAAIDAARKYGWRLSLQTHKLLGLP
jgi:7-carboxy-7-deazaguanine synthase